MDNDFSRIGLGTVQFGLQYGIANNTGKPKTEEVELILIQAKGLGIDLLDTASVYGDSEKIIGDSGSNNFKVVSKWTDNPKSSIQKSLKQLKTAQLYGWMAHNSKTLLSNPENWEIMKDQQSEGNVEKIGYSIYHPQELKKLLDKNFVPDIIQIPYSILDTRFSKWLKPLQALGTEVHCRSIFLQGLFFMNPDKLDSFFNPIKNWLLAMQQKPTSRNNLLANLINYVLLTAGVDKVIIGIDNNKQLIEIANALTSYEQINFPEINEVPERILNPSLWPLRN